MHGDSDFDANGEVSPENNRDCETGGNRNNRISCRHLLLLKKRRALLKSVAGQLLRRITC